MMKFGFLVLSFARADIGDAQAVRAAAESVEPASLMKSMPGVQIQEWYATVHQVFPCPETCARRNELPLIAVYCS